MGVSGETYRGGAGMVLMVEKSNLLHLLLTRSFFLLLGYFLALFLVGRSESFTCVFPVPPLHFHLLVFLFPIEER